MGRVVSDPTLATVDSEPWNQSPAEQRRAALKAKQKTHAENAPVLNIEKALSVYERIRRGLPILTPDGQHAEYVYHVIGASNGPEECHGCGARCGCAFWHEWRRLPVSPKAFKYAAVRVFYLCNTCGNRLRKMPLGAKWKGKDEWEE